MTLLRHLPIFGDAAGFDKAGFIGRRPLQDGRTLGPAVTAVVIAQDVGGTTIDELAWQTVQESEHDLAGAGGILGVIGRSVGAH